VNKMLRRIFGPKREDVAGGWRRLHFEELRNFCASQDATRMIKSRGRRMSSVGHIASMGEMKYA
jgi:hypothetical protein